ncbi:uncharacterized protein LOC116341248 [Contarinia nasturtii]|uniref:uncharacterized protein LOC116341248 n=1 Tax=Contarinia nasturtii TaxID=265458 RepID=UPI0012D40076|nr:uncharacterized protein LOC116341248 [Contarinia nasturtii]
MHNTPDKNALNTSAFSPVRFTDSPSHLKSLKNDNIGIRTRLKATAKTLVENHRKWDAAHRRGITLCKSIEKCKSHAIKTFNDSTDTNVADKTLYPTELKAICDKLQVITTIFEDVRNSANESRRQIVSFIKLGLTNVFADSSLVYRTWDCTMLQSATDRICDAYENEYEMKVKVMENIAHSRNDDELAMHLAVWEYQTHVDSDIEMLIKSLIIEADIELDDKTS